MKFNQKLKLTPQRVETLYQLLKQIKISESHLEFIQKNESKCLQSIDESLTHSSISTSYNHERLEFLGDAVLRLAASEFIQINYPNLSVGQRSELRSQIVSDEWLTSLGNDIGIKKIMRIGPKAIQDEAASDTLKAEATEALIGALYECFQEMEIIDKWLSPYWLKESTKVILEPFKYNSKSALQEWSQGKGLSKPNYETIEFSKEHGDKKRFFCKVHIAEKFIADGWGSSRKKAEKEAALLALEKLKNFKTKPP